MQIILIKRYEKWATARFQHLLGQIRGKGNLGTDRISELIPVIHFKILRLAVRHLKTQRLDLKCILFAVLYGYEYWCVILREECRLRVHDRLARRVLETYWKVGGGSAARTGEQEMHTNFAWEIKGRNNLRNWGGRGRWNDKVKMDLK
jgi:hypothetical protein